MSQPRRRRRRRRRGAPRTEASRPAEQAAQPSEAAPQQAARGRRRRRRRGGRGAGPPGPRTLEEVEQAIKGPTPSELTAPADGQRLEDIIGDLQSRWGVPQYPQEYRITLKVADEPKAQPAPPPSSENGGVTREKAPAAPRVAPSGSEGGVKREKAPGRRRRSRRGRRRK
jgi:hypothetical protein